MLMQLVQFFVAYFFRFAFYPNGGDLIVCQIPFHRSTHGEKRYFIR